MSSLNKNNGLSDNKQEVVSITYEEIGLFPRSFSRVLDRFLKQVFSDVENLVIQEYRFYRYLFLTTLKCLLILFFVPFFVNFVAKTYVVKPLTEYFWNTKQTEIFLNSYQQKRAFAELKDFEEKIYFESLIYPKSTFLPVPYKQSISNFDPKNNIEGTSGSLPSECLTVPNPSCPSRFAREARSAGAQPQKGTSVSNPTSCASQSNTVEMQRETASDCSFLETNSSESHSVIPSSSFTPKFSQSFALKTKDFNEGKETVNLQNSSEINGSLKEKTDEKTESLINSVTVKSSLFVYQTQEADKNIQQRYQEKTIELAQRYNDQSIEAITNFFADLISLFTLFYLLYALEIQINITKSFLLEVFFGLDDSKKSLLILLVTDLLVGYHSSNLWELFFEFLFHHYGLPESQTGIFLLVATLPVLLDVLFKYLIFRHLNRSSPATVATYHAMIE